MAEDDDRFWKVYIDSIKLRAERYRLRAEVDAERQQARRIRCNRPESEPGYSGKAQKI
ncbi:MULTISPECIES: hypothetical protein [unclassified Mesorhizobium]|uniref:hypothetical protein n=1 Tax=unclassified Mesorhizobium TaxID=325217 RepID=UPI0012EA57AA|nr:MULTISPECIES: hypothetical protein [unclassified Mesorhizobium]MDG4850973.1 hypothetical protein [Mesorhizobium sp. WSM4982]MDG4912251.1 hypothetical protein [Mesorhizobium sp. WSM4983]